MWRGHCDEALLGGNRHIPSSVLNGPGGVPWACSEEDAIFFQEPEWLPRTAETLRRGRKGVAKCHGVLSPLG